MKPQHPLVHPSEQPYRVSSTRCGYADSTSNQKGIALAQNSTSMPKEPLYRTPSSGPRSDASSENKHTLIKTLAGALPSLPLTSAASAMGGTTQGACACSP